MSNTQAQNTDSAFAKPRPAVDDRLMTAATSTTVRTLLGPLYVDDQGAADEPVALLWPSLFTDHRMWRPLIAVLREAGWRTIAIDPPGHGGSRGIGRGFTMDECAEAAIQVLDAASVRTPVVVLGTSWGGFVAPRVALRAPDRVRGMVLFNTSAERPSSFDRAKTTLLTKLLAVESIRNAVDGICTSSMLCAETKRERPELARDLTERLSGWDRRGVIATVRSVLVDRDAVLDALGDVTTPTLIVSGKEDHLLPSIHSQRIAGKLSNSRHVEVAGAAHLVPLEQPRAAASLVLDFIRQLPA